jgi:hypothetical protein
MELASLIAWVLTAGGGLVMLSIWLRAGGPRQRDRSQIRSVQIFGHFGLAASGLVLWIVYFFTDAAAAGWIAFVLLAAAAVAGIIMFFVWAQQRQPGGQAPTETAEQRFPVPIVAGHGLLAVLTAVLVLLVNLGVGE